MYREWQPPLALKTIIDCIWTFTIGDETGHMRIIPDNCIDLIFNFNKGVIKIFWNGAMTKSTLIPLDEAADFIGIRFKPGGASIFLSIPLNELTDKQVSFSDMNFKDESLLANLTYIKNQNERVKFIFKWLMEKNISGPNLIYSKKNIISVLSNIKYKSGLIKVSSIADECNISRQYLIKICREYIGIDPKIYFRIFRVQKALKMIDFFKLKDVNWADIAIDCGYYDQSHLINEFKEIVGTTPSSINPVEFTFFQYNQQRMF